MINIKRKILYLSIPIIFMIMFLSPIPNGMSNEAFKVGIIAILMALLWLTEAIPLAITALIPIVLFPALGIMSSSNVTATYANNLIFLFIGGFFIAKAIEKWSLHKRIALSIIKLVGVSPNRLILGFMLGTAVLSAWISNTATAMMMIPIGISVISQITNKTPSQISTGEGVNYPIAIAIMLAIAWGASIGGMATIIGTPPNLVLVSQIKTMYDIDISFLQWMIFGIPISICLLFAAWLILTKVLFKFNDINQENIKENLQNQINELKAMSREEIIIISVGSLVVSLWILRGIFSEFIKVNLPQLSLITDTTIGIMGAIVLFAIPSNLDKGEFILDWKTAVQIPWGIVLLVGGGLALAAGFKQSGLTEYLSLTLASLKGLSLISFILVVTVFTIFLTEITSNTAIASLLIPVLGASAVALSIHPFGPVVAACLASSAAFMLPVATPPNAIVFGSGCMDIKNMAKAGIYLNIIAIFIITIMVVFLLPLLWGINLSESILIK